MTGFIEKIAIRVETKGIAIGEPGHVDKNPKTNCLIYQWHYSWHCFLLASKVGLFLSYWRFLGHVLSQSQENQPDKQAMSMVTGLGFVTSALSVL